MSYCGYVTRIKNLHKHSNADRLLVGECFGNNVIVSTDYTEGQLGVYFPVDGRLSKEFCEANDLVRRKDENGNNCGGYLDPEKRNITAIRLRGEKSDGLFLPIGCLESFTDIKQLKDGDVITVLNGVEICRKYIPNSNSRRKGAGGGSSRAAKKNFAPTFYEHVETEQLAYHLNELKAGDVIELTLKMHGSSQRTGYLPLVHTKRTWLDKLLHRHGKDYTEYGYVTGTRRVVLDNEHHGGYYEDNSFRIAMADKFKGKLRKGETVYYEVVGFQGKGGAPIMPSVSNKKISDREFTRKYGDMTVFSYGCDPDGGYDDNVIIRQDEIEDGYVDVFAEPCCNIYVYRMTMVNEDGDTVEYSPDQMRHRCDQIGVHYVPVMERFIIPETEDTPDEDGFYKEINAGEYVLKKAEEYYDGADPVGRTHIREGVVIRVVSSPEIRVYKHKNFSFKVLEGIAKDVATAPDIEEAQEEGVSECQECL